MPEEKSIKSCSNCGAEIDKKAKICPKCGVEQPLIPEKVSNWWYILAIFLGAIGGVIAWAVNKDRNPKKSIRFLIVGLVLSAIYIIVGILASIILVSLGEARERARDAIIMANLDQIRIMAKIIYFDEGNNYSTVSCTHPEIVFLCQDIKAQSGEEPIVHSTQKDYCIYTELLAEDYYCIDSKGVVRETSVYPGGTGYCDGRTFICP